MCIEKARASRSKVGLKKRKKMQEWKELADEEGEKLRKAVSQLAKRWARSKPDGKIGSGNR